MNQSDSHLFKLTSVIFNAALGATYYNQFSSILEEVGIDVLASTWGDSEITKSILGNTAEEQAKGLTQNLGLNPNNPDQNSGDYIAYHFFLTNLQSGMNVGSLALAAIRYLEQETILESLETSKSYLNNRAEVGYQYSSDLGLGGTDVTSLQKVLGNVTSDELSISSTLAQVSEDAFAAIRASSAAVSYSSDDDNVAGTEGSDYIDVQSGYDTVKGGNGADIIIGGSGNDALYGERGQDMIEGGDGADFIDAGSYYSRTYIKSHYNDNNEYVDGYYVYSVDALFEVLNGGSGTDTIYGGYGSDAVNGGEGDDILYGEGYRYTELSEDALGSFDSSTLLRLMNDTITGGGGSDTIYGQQGNDSINGGEGNDYIDSGSGNDTVIGEDGNDNISGGSGSDSLFSGAGNDKLYAYKGADTVYGGAGDDIIFLGKSNSSYNQEAASDGEIDFAYGEEGNDSIYGQAGDNIDAGAGDDYIYFSRGDNSEEQSVIVAGEGNDEIYIDYDDSYGSSKKASTILTINLSESTSSQDIIGFDLSGRITSAVEIQEFDLSKDKIDFNKYIDLYNADYISNQSQYFSNGSLNSNVLQIVTSPSTSWLERADDPTNPEQYGKGYFAIQGASAASSGLDDIAKLIDNYGNNATYTKSDEHIFIVNINESDLGIYLFKDDTGANDRIVSDELTPLVILAGVQTEDINYENANFLIS